jgi:hypothetical protein
MDGPWVTPYQITSKSDYGPVLIAQDWLDDTRIKEHGSVLLERGYLPALKFNIVLDNALRLAGLTRREVYVTQACLLIACRGVHQPVVDNCFDAVVRHETAGRRVLTLGAWAMHGCKRHGISAVNVCHPSARGLSNDEKARRIAAGLSELGYSGRRA